MNPWSFRLTSLKCIISLRVSSQLHIYNVSFRYIYVFTAYVNICTYMQFLNHAGSFLVCSLHLYFLSLFAFTSHFLLNLKICNPDIFFFIILSCSRASCFRKIMAEVRKWCFFGLKIFSRCRSNCMPLICFSVLSGGVLWLLGCAGTGENWVQLFPLLLSTWMSWDKPCKVWGWENTVLVPNYCSRSW